MESRKRKREPDAEFNLPRITYHVKQLDRVFERLFKESSREELCDIVRTKLNLDSKIPLELHQFRDGVLYDLEDDDDFNAFKAATYAHGSLAVYVKYSTGSPPTSELHRPKGKASKKSVSTPDSSKDEHAQNINAVYNQIADTPTHDEPPRKKRKKESDASAPGEKSNLSFTPVTPRKKPKSAIRGVNGGDDAEGSTVSSAKPIFSGGKTNKSVKEKKSEEREEEGEKGEEEEGKKKKKKKKLKEIESSAMKGKSQTVATTEKTDTSQNNGKRKKSIGKSSVDTPESSTKTYLAAADSYKADGVEAKHNSLKEPQSKQEKKGGGEQEKDHVHPPSPSKEAKSVEKPKRKKKDVVEAAGVVADNEEPPKKKKKVPAQKVISEEAPKKEKELNDMRQEAVSLLSTEDATVSSIANSAAEFPTETSTTLKENGKVSSSACTVVPLSTPSHPPAAAPPLSALTGSNKNPTRKPNPKLQLCPLCNELFHFRSKCPIITDGVESIEKKKAELHAKGGQEALISELEVWIQKTKASGSFVATSSASTIPTTPAALKSNQAGSHTRTVFPIKSVRSEVTVESHGEGSESDDSTSDGEDNATQTSSSSESPPPSASPSINLEDVDLGALVRGPAIKSLTEAFCQLEEEEEQGGEGAYDGERESLLEEDEEEEKMQKHLKVLRSKRVSFSELRMEGDEDEDESVSVDNDKSRSNEVPPVLPGRQPVQMTSNVSPSHEESLENILRNTSNVEGERTELHCAPVPEETFEGKRVTDETTPATEGTTEVPGDNTDPLKLPKRVNFADLAADESDVEEKNFLGGKNMDDISFVTPAYAIAHASDIGGETTPATSSTRSPSPHLQNRWTSLSPARLPVSKTYVRSPTIRRMRHGNPQVDEAYEGVTEEQPTTHGNGTNETPTRRMRDKDGNSQADEADEVVTEEQPIINDNSTKETAMLTKTTAVEPSSPVENPKRGRPSRSTSQRASSEVSSVPSTSQSTAKRRGRPPLSEVVKAERQALKDAKAAEKKAKEVAKKAAPREAKKADSQIVTERPPKSASTASVKSPAQAENSSSNETEQAAPLHRGNSLIKDPLKASNDRDSRGSLSSPFMKSLPVGSQWKVLPPPSETEPSQSSPQVDQLISSQATPKDIPLTIMSTRNKVQSPFRFRSVSHLVDEADVEEIIGTAENYEENGRQPAPLFLPGASQPTQAFSGPFFSGLRDSETEEAEEGVRDDESEYGSAGGKQYRDGSPSATSSRTEASSDEEPTARSSITHVPAAKIAIKSPFPSLSQLTSSMQHLTRVPSFLMPPRFAKMSQGQSQSQKKDSMPKKRLQANGQNDGESSEDEEDEEDSSEEERKSHIPKEKRAGAAVVKKKKGLLED